MLRVIAVPVLVAVLLGAAPAAQQFPLTARGIISRMEARNPSLESYRARVHVNVRMLNFPYLAPKLDGTSYYKRPDAYEVVFDRIPSYAKGFGKIFNDVGDPGAWGKDQDITYQGTSLLDGHPMLVLLMTKKIHSDILAYTLAYVDPQSYELAQMEWHYTNGGKITMMQSYRSEGTYSVISSQHAAIDIPHVRAVADSTYGAYQTNVAVDSGIFEAK